MMAAGVSPEPTNYPTSFTAVPSGVAINLEWVDAIGDQLPSGYLVKASTTSSIDLPVDGVVVPDDTDLSDGSGALNIAYGQQACSFGALDANTTYYFSIFPYTNGGANIDYKTDGNAPEANATTADLAIIESENFDNGFGAWTKVSVVGELEWIIDPEYGIGGTPCAKCTGYDGSPNANEDWLISPPLNFNNYTQEVLSFFTADAYDGPALELLISNDYDGSDPTSATWTNLEFETSTGFFEWISSGDIDVSAVDGSEVYIAFKFTSTDMESATWEVDDILITGTESPSSIAETNTFGFELKVYPNPARDQVSITADSYEKLNISIYSMLGTQVVESTVFTGSLDVDLSGLNQGIYFIQVSDQEGNAEISKLLIER